MMRESLYKFAWDTRCRNVDVARVLRPFLSERSRILDAGCGEYGLAAFMSGANIMGVDILPEEAVDPRLNYIHGSIIDLPFDAGSFDIAVSVDVLEHLPEELRPEAVKQLVKVATKAIVITFPDGEGARKIDADFERKLNARNMALPEWLEEHLAQNYPGSEQIAAEVETAAKAAGRIVKTRVVYSEHSAVSRFLRWAAARSKYIYVPANLAAGAFLPIMPTPSAGNAYRAIVIAEFESER